MDEQLEQQLIACLDALAAGETIEQILQRFPEQRDQLRPLLETATAIQAIQATPSRTAQLASRRAFLNAAREIPQPSGWFSLRFVAIALAILLCLVLGGGSVIASEEALPGDTLYAVKRSVEQVRLATSSNRTVVERQLEDLRRDEVRRVLASGRVTDIAFSGRIESIQNNTWVVAGIQVQITAATQVEGIAAIGANAHVQGQAQATLVLAQQIQIEAGSTPIPPTLLPSNTPMPTPSPIPPAPSPTVTASPTLTLSPSPSPIPPTPTKLPAPVPTKRLPPPAPVVQPTNPPILEPTSATPDDQFVNDTPTATPENAGNPTPELTATVEDNQPGNDNPTPSPDGNGNGNDNSGSNGNDNSNDDHGGGSP